MVDRDRADRLFSAVPGFVLMFLMAFCAVALQAQTAPPTTQTPPALPMERPGNVYKELMQPLDQVRSSMDNWSPAELAALAAGVKRAHRSIAGRLPRQALVATICISLHAFARLGSGGMKPMPQHPLTTRARVSPIRRKPMRSASTHCST